MQATITSKGQVTVPKPIRDKLHLKPGDTIDFVLDEDGDLRIAPIKARVTELKGMLPKPRAPVTLERMNEAIANPGHFKGVPPGATTSFAYRFGMI